MARPKVILIWPFAPLILILAWGVVGLDMATPAIWLLLLPTRWLLPAWWVAGGATDVWLLTGGRGRLAARAAPWVPATGLALNVLWLLVWWFFPSSGWRM